MVRPIACLILGAALAACQSASQEGEQGGSDAGGGAYRDTFTVSKTALAPGQGNRYFLLAPGTVHRYRGGDETLVITVLKETRIVDGVTTRVVEEREERAGKPLETSINFFATDSATGDVYYFGEEVDVFKDGKVSGHPGVWLSGEDGGRFGLIMPARPRVGDRYYQEIAPGEAMDRAEVVALDETVVVPAGTFKNCLHTRETSPLERGSSDKWYAPGIGLVKDEDMVLESYTMP